MCYYFISLGLFLNDIQDAGDVQFAGALFTDITPTTGESFNVTFTNEINVLGYTTNTFEVSLKDTSR